MMNHVNFIDKYSKTSIYRPGVYMFKYFHYSTYKNKKASKPSRKCATDSPGLRPEFKIIFRSLYSNVSEPKWKSITRVFLSSSKKCHACFRLGKISRLLRTGLVVCLLLMENKKRMTMTTFLNTTSINSFRRRSGICISDYFVTTTTGSRRNLIIPRRKTIVTNKPW